MSMFCYQCQETANGTGCTIAGICGKKDDLANMQDLLVYVVKGLGIVHTEARELGIKNSKVDEFIVNSLFMTITNANWDKNDFYNKVRDGLNIREEIKSSIEKAGSQLADTSDFVTWYGETTLEFENKAASQEVSILATRD